MALALSPRTSAHRIKENIMAEKQTIMGRITQLAKDINALLDRLRTRRR